MEGVKNETRRLIIANFYRKNSERGKAFTVDYFKKLNVNRRQVYRAIARVEAGQSHLWQEGPGRPRKLTKRQEKQIVKAMENKNATFH